MASDEQSPVRKAFAGSTILITGSTGFLGMLLTEKILRSLPDVKKLYLLVRPYKGVPTSDRVQRMLDNEIFHIVKKRTPNYKLKVSAVEGDVSEVGVGLSNDDRQRLMEEVNIIFHGAATVKFNDNLKRAVKINVRGTKEMVLLAKGCVNLRAFVHISTAFCNTAYGNVLEEKFYKSHIDPDDLITLMDCVDDAMAAKMMPGLIDPFPNTYAFSKNAAENVILKHASDLPMVMLRPCLVVSCYKEPLPGWSNSIYGLGGFFLAQSMGIFHVCYGSRDIIMDTLPSDYVINTCIASTWKTLSANKMAAIENKMDASGSKMAPPAIYSVGSSWRNPMSWGKALDDMQEYIDMYPPPYAVSYNWICFTNSKIVKKLANFFLLFIPAVLADAVRRLKGGKPKYVALHGKLEDFEKVVANWLSTEWRFKDDNTLSLIQSMSDKDKQEFNCDVADWDLKDFLKCYVIGSRRYVLKEPDESIPAAKRLRNLLAVIHYSICVFLFAIVAYVFYSTMCVGLKYV